MRFVVRSRGQHGADGATPFKNPPSPPRELRCRRASEYTVATLSYPNWRALYESDLQGLYGSVPVPAVFLAYRLARGRPRAAREPLGAFVDALALVFAIETIADAFTTGWLLRALGVGEGRVATAVLVVFVLLGDFRVYMVIFGATAIAAGRRWTQAIGRAVMWTFVVPVAAYAIDALLRATIGGLHPDSIWLVYEVLFVAVALALRGRLLRHDLVRADPTPRRFVSAVLLYSAVYYALWAISDMLIQVFGMDVGWLLRIVPNQLYYGFWVPMVYRAFFSRR